MIAPTRFCLALGVILDFDLKVCMPAGKQEKFHALIERMKNKEILQSLKVTRCLQPLVRGDPSQKNL